MITLHYINKPWYASDDKFHISYDLVIDGWKFERHNEKFDTIEEADYKYRQVWATPRAYRTA